MVIENRVDVRTDAVRPEQVSKIDNASFSPGFRHSPAHDFREVSTDISEVLSAPGERHELSAGQPVSQQYRVEILIGNIAAHVGLTPAGAHLLGQILLKGSVEAGPVPRSEVARLFAIAADALEDVKLVPSVIRTSGLSYDEVEGVRRTLREKSDILKSVAEKQAIQDLEGVLKAHNVYSPDVLRRLLSSLEREMKYGNSQGERSAFVPEDAGRIKTLLENSQGMDRKVLNAALNSMLQESMGKAEPGQAQEYFRSLLVEGKSLNQKAIAAILDIYLSKSEVLDRDDVATVLFLARARTEPVTEVNSDRVRPSMLFTGAGARLRGPNIDVISMAGLDPAAERVASDFVLSEGQQAARKKPDYSLHSLQHLDAEKWHRTIETIKQNYDSQPLSPPLAMTGGHLKISRGIEMAFERLGVDGLVIEARKSPQGPSVKWQIFYDGI